MEFNSNLQATISKLIVEIQSYDSDTFYGANLSKNDTEQIAAKLIEEFVTNNIGYTICGDILNSLEQRSK